jgi:hypothetical protein
MLPSSRSMRTAGKMNSSTPSSLPAAGQIKGSMPSSRPAPSGGRSAGRMTCLLRPLTGTDHILHKLFFLLLILSLVATPQATKLEMSADGERPKSATPTLARPFAPPPPSMAEFDICRFYFFLVSAPCAGGLTLFGFMCPGQPTSGTDRQADKEPPAWTC